MSLIQMYTLEKFPAIIFAIISLAILIGISFSPVVEKEDKPVTFAISIVVLMTWFLVIYWYCATNNIVLGWFFLLLPFGILLMWYLSRWLHSASFRGSNQQI